MIAKIAKKNTAIVNSSARTNFVLVLIFLMCAAVIGRLYYIQIVLGEHYRVWAQGLQSYSRQTDLPDRGEIFFGTGQPLAVNKDFDYAYASPANIKDKDSAAAIVSQILGLDKNDLAEKFNKESLYASIKEKLSEKEAADLKAANIEGVYVAQKKMRYYPQGALAAQLAGFVDESGEGRYGLEEYYNEELAQGKSIFLNLDYNIQYQAESMLAAAVKKLNAIDGEAIVANPKTGAILAMAQSPNFDSNNYKEYAKKNGRMSVPCARVVKR